MADRSSKLPVPREEPSSGLPEEWRPLERLRREIDRLFENFGSGFFRGSLFDAAPFGSGQSLFPAMPAIDVTETDKAYEITAELPGMDEKNIEVKVANGVLSITGEQRKESKDDNVYEASFASFQRAFKVPDGVDADRIEATFKNGVLSVTLPKGKDAQMSPRRIPGNDINI